MSTIEPYLNRVFQKDIFELLRELPTQSVDMIFGDPDYNVDIKYDGTSYTTTFDEYINWYIDLAKESYRVLKDNGNMFLINYPKQNAYLRVNYLDQVFYEVREYVWVYNTNTGHSNHRFTTTHRSILHCRKSSNNRFYKEQVAEPYKNPKDKRNQKLYARGSKGRMPYDWFEINLVKNTSKEKTIHPCQIPQKLTQLLVKASTKENDIVLVLFGGSGSELEVCKQLNRNFISAEIEAKYCELINNRLKNGRISINYQSNTRRKKQNPIPEQIKFPY